MIVVEDAADAKAAASSLVYDAYYFANAINTQLATAFIRGRQQNFDTDIASNWRAFAAQNECSIQRNIYCEPALGMVPSIVPMEDNG